MLLSKRHVEPRVLLIEDAEETRELSRLALESQACHVVGVSSAEAALGLLAAGERFDLLFTDVNLGPISGIEAANRVRGLYPQLPILVTSGMDQPYNMSELLDAIRLCFRHADVGVLIGPDAQAA
jgi:CheY-like chemotaxis protein